jgi:hypothetical protein
MNVSAFLNLSVHHNVLLNDINEFQSWFLFLLLILKDM